MTIDDSLTAYIASQKTVAIAFLVLSSVLIASSLAIYLLSEPSRFLQGYKIGALIFGVLIAVGGGTYLFTNARTHDKLKAAHKANPGEFVSSEQKRMAKVVKGFPVYQYVGSAFILVALGIILFAGRPFWSGIAIAVAFHFLGFMFVELVSHSSIKQHHDYILTASVTSKTS